MKIALLQSGNNGFFPRFYNSLREVIVSNGYECMLFAPNNGSNNRCVLPNQVLWGSRVNWHIHNYLFKLTGATDVFSHLSTWDLISKLNRYLPDVIHMHIVNDNMLNLPMFVKYVNKHNISVVWTMHDCRAFTGGCAYPDEARCEKWKDGCHACSLTPKHLSLLKNSSTRVWNIRKLWHSSFKKMHIVTPSLWLSELVNHSFLCKYPIDVIYNGIDLSVFNTTKALNLRQTYGLGNAKLILGVANVWEDRKGLNYFLELSRILSDGYKVALIGSMTEEQQKKSQGSILCLGRITSINELVAWYQEADVFVNPTMSDNFPTTNIEALAAGTPVVTFDTGGSPEAIDASTGIVVKQGSLAGLRNAVIQICTHPYMYSEKNCKERSKFFSRTQYARYVELYRTMI